MSRVRIIVAWFSVSLLFGCAKPNYAPTTIVTGTGSLEEKTQSCGLKFSTGECLAITWEKVPTETDFGSFIFKTFRPNLADASPVLEDMSGKLSVLLWMPSMGHGSAPVRVDRLDIGTYRVSNVFFSMKGSWEIRFQSKNEDGSQSRVSVPYKF